MKLLISLFTAYLFLISGCTRDGKCDCVPPPVTESNWKLTLIFGGFAGEEKPMNDDQKNSLLTITSIGQYTCKNTITGITTTGGFAQATQGNGILKLTFSPLLPIYPTASFQVIEKTDQRMVLSDGNPDGYTLTFIRQN